MRMAFLFFPVLQLKCRGSLFIVRPSHQHTVQIHLSRFNESVSVRHSDQIHLSRFNESVSVRYTDQIHLSRLNESHSHFKLFQATVFNSISQWISLRKCPGNYIKNILKKYALNFPFSNNPPQIHIDMHISPHHDLFFRVGTLPGLNPPKSPTSMATGYRWIVSP